MSSYIHKQTQSSTNWSITHNLNGYPLTDVLVNITGRVMKVLPKAVEYVDANTVRVTFSEPQTGTVRLFAQGANAIDLVNVVAPVAPEGTQPVAVKVEEPYWSNVSSLIHMEDGAVTDDKNNTVTLKGGATISTADSRFGTSSLYLPGDNRAKLLVSDSPGLAFGTGDFTIEMFIKPVGQQASIAGLFYQRTSNNLVFCLYNGKLALWNGTFYSSIIDVPLDVWSHVAVSRVNGVLKFFINGELSGTAQDSTNYTQNNGPTTIGSDTGDFNQPFKGYIDEIRVTNNVARYTGTFTPPTEAFSQYQ